MLKMEAALSSEAWETVYHAKSKKQVKPFLIDIVLVTRPAEHVFTAIYPQLRLNT
jgi:hypothetical protein